MGSNIDETKGRVKEAVGDLTDDKDMKREGKMDRLGADIKDKAEDAKDAVGDLVDNVKDKLGGKK